MCVVSGGGGSPLAVGVVASDGKPFGEWKGGDVMRLGRKKAVSGCYKHLLIRGVVPGWFVCLWCGLGVVCPGCVPDAPAEARYHVCREHEASLGTHDLRNRRVWAAEGSAR